MPTIYSHGVVGLGLGKVCFARPMTALFWILAGLLPMVPDFDAFSPAAYGHPLGHRGFTHSLLFALALGMIAAGATFQYFKVGFWLLAGFFFAITASHGILDAFTNSGFGIPFFWPFFQERFGPWGPIKVADIGFEWPDPSSSRAVRSELVWVWLPTFMVVGLVLTFRGLRRALSRRQHT